MNSSTGAEKRGRGRPKQNNTEALEAALASPQKREVLIEQLQKLLREKEAIKARSKLYGEDVKSVAEAYGMGSGFLSKIVSSMMSDDIEKEIGLLTNQVDLLSIIKEAIEEL